MSLENRPSNARDIALAALTETERTNSNLDNILDRLFRRPSISSREKALAHELACGVVRREMTLDAVISGLARKNISRLHPVLLHILRLALYQIIYLDRIPDYAAVDEAVKQARGKLNRSAAGFANALLRRFVESGKQIPLPSRAEQPARFISIKHSHPAWLVERWIDLFGEEKTERICENNNSRPPLVVRVNRNKTTLAGLLSALEQEQIDAVVLDEDLGAIQFGSPGKITGIEAFKLGLFYVQDLTAMRVAKFASPAENELILDACAAPGGKCTHIAELTGNRTTVVALDRSPEKMQQVMQNVARLAAASIVPIVGDAGGLSRIFKEQSFDRIVLDAPCSNSGVFRRRVEARRRLKPGDFAHYHGLQLWFLLECAPLVKRGGRLVYSTCSIDPEENEQVVEDFLGRDPDFWLEEQQTYLPSENSADGGFMARMVHS